MAVRREKDTIAVHKIKTAKIALERKSTLLFAWLSMFVSFCGNAIGVGIFMLFSINHNTGGHSLAVIKSLFSSLFYSTLIPIVPFAAATILGIISIHRAVEERTGHIDAIIDLLNVANTFMVMMIIFPVMAIFKLSLLYVILLFFYTLLCWYEVFPKLRVRRKYDEEYDESRARKVGLHMNISLLILIAMCIIGI